MIRADATPPPTGDTGHPGPGLSDLVRAAGFDLSELQIGQLYRYRDLLYERNAVTNLTAVRELSAIERRLLLESLRLVPVLRSLPAIADSGNHSLIDVGTGGGLPGMVLAIACPEWTVFLLDATGKKVAFLNEAIAEIQLANAFTIHGRAEEVGHQPRYRDSFDVVTARAVASLPVLLELGVPLLRIGGHLLFPKGAGISDELDAAGRAAGILGAEVTSSAFLPDAGSTIDTRLVIARKLSPTPHAYPRRTGVPAKDPLGTGSASASQARKGRHQRGTS